LFLSRLASTTWFAFGTEEIYPKHVAACIAP
jgi:hypothetical protein